MHLPFIPRGATVVLASSSPRRADLLRDLGVNLHIQPSTFEENLDKDKHTPEEYVIETARHKAEEVARVVRERRPDLVVAADTVVVVDEHILEKPADREHAVAMLQRLSGRDHTVLTGVAVARYSDDFGAFKVHTFCERTTVTFAKLTDDILQAYVDSGEPMDKAGGYGIQGLGKCLVKAVHGCYFNVVGFPVHSFCQHIVTYK